MESELIDKNTLAKEITDSKFLLQFQKNALIELIEEHPWATEDEGIIDRVLYRLLGKYIRDLSPEEQLEVTYAIQDFR